MGSQGGCDGITGSDFPDVGAPEKNVVNVSVDLCAEVEATPAETAPAADLRHAECSLFGTKEFKNKNYSIVGTPDGGRPGGGGEVAKVVPGKPDRKPAPKVERPRDLEADHFSDAFSDHYGIPYTYHAGDFPGLARLRKGLGAVLVRERWTTAVGNYFATPQSIHSLRDLCSRFATFQKGKLDRYNKPEGYNQNVTNLVESIAQFRQPQGNNGQDNPGVQGFGGLLLLD